MKFTNHHSNRFMATTDDIGQSLVNDVWTLVNQTDRALNRWQKAADQGYGLVPSLGNATDATLASISEASLTVGQLIARAYRWYTNGGQDQLIDFGWTIARGAALFLLFVVCLACVLGFGMIALVKGLGVMADAVADALSLDGSGPCWGNPPDWSCEVAAIDDSSALTEWAFARFGRITGELPQPESLIAWAQGLR